MKFKNLMYQLSTYLKTYISMKKILHISFTSIIIFVICACALYGGITFKAILVRLYMEDTKIAMDIADDRDTTPIHELAASKKDPLRPVGDTININTATKEELMSLPNIGAKKAEDIIAHRLNHAFTSPDQLTEVKGIGEKTYEKLKAYIRV